MPRRYRPEELAQTPSEDRDGVVTDLTRGTAEVAGGYKALAELGRLAARSRDSGLLERSRFLSSAVLAQVQAWSSAQRLVSRPLLYLALKSGYLRELEAYALLARAGASLDLNDPETAEQDLRTLFGLSLPPSIFEKLAPDAQEQLAIARLRQRHWAEAEDAAEVAVRSARARGDRTRLARALLLLSEALLRCGRVPQSIEVISEANDIAVDIDDLGVRGDVYHVRAKIAAAEGLLHDAMNYANLANGAYTKIEARVSMAAIHLLQKEIERASGQAS